MPLRLADHLLSSQLTVRTIPDLRDVGTIIVELERILTPISLYSYDMAV